MIDLSRYFDDPEFSDVELSLVSQNPSLPKGTIYVYSGLLHECGFFKGKMDGWRPSKLARLNSDEKLNGAIQRQIKREENGEPKSNDNT